MKFKLLTLISLITPFLTFAQDSSDELSWGQRIDQQFQPVADTWESIVLYPISIGGYNMPIVLILLVLGATFFTIYFGFPGIKRFPLAINTVRGKYDELEEPEGHGVEKAEVNIVEGDLPDTIRDESKHGEVSHFQALATAVSGTVGLG